MVEGVGIGEVRPEMVGRQQKGQGGRDRSGWEGTERAGGSGQKWLGGNRKGRGVGTEVAGRGQKGQGGRCPTPGCAVGRWGVGPALVWGPEPSTVGGWVVRPCLAARCGARSPV